MQDVHLVHWLDQDVAVGTTSKQRDLSSQIEPSDDLDDLVARAAVAIAGDAGSDGQAPLGNQSRISSR